MEDEDYGDEESRGEVYKGRGNDERPGQRLFNRHAEEEGCMKGEGEGQGDDEERRRQTQRLGERRTKGEARR